MYFQWGTIAPNRTKIVPWGVLKQILILQGMWSSKPQSYLIKSYSLVFNSSCWVLGFQGYHMSSIDAEFKKGAQNVCQISSTKLWLSKAVNRGLSLAQWQSHIVRSGLYMAATGCCWPCECCLCLFLMLLCVSWTLSIK